jgi:hypothetical protein
MKTIRHPLTGKAFRMGRKRPRARGLRLRLASYLLKSLPQPPAECNYTPAAKSWLAQMLANNDLGDCTAAGAFHIAGTWLANNGLRVPFTQEDTIKFYSATTGYVPGKPETDQGGDEETVLNYWVNHGLLPTPLPAHQAQAWISVNAADIEEVKTAIWLFGNIYIGASLPDAWVNPMPETDGWIWGAAGAPEDDNGHCFAALGYDERWLKISTWGLVGNLTPAGLAKYAVRAAGGECYSILGSDWISAAKQKAPNGFDALQLASDINDMRA